MHHAYSKLLLYSDLGEDSILQALADIYRDWEEHNDDPAILRRRLLVQVKRLLDLATSYGFDENLWANYLAFLLITNENSFSLCCERSGAHPGSVNHFALRDFHAFFELLHYDFSRLETALDVDCFHVLSDYQAVPKQERHYHKRISRQVRALSRALMDAEDADDIFALVTDYYRDLGVGMLGLNRAFRVRACDGVPELLPVNNTDGVHLDDLVGYDVQKQDLRENTEAFLEGRLANNVLLYGDSGTGKSSCVKALINEYYERGLRMIELYKNQFPLLTQLITQTKNRNYRFIFFIDDLSFEENELEYKYLKALIEGGVETKPDNILIYATSNRRHLVRETWRDRDDVERNGDVHRSDTMEEKLSLSARFGMQINFSSPGRESYHAIVRALAARVELALSDEQLIFAANRWEVRHGGMSGRTAQQFINHMAGKQGR